MARKRYGRTIAKWLAACLLALVAYAGLQYGALLKEMDRASSLYSRGDLDGALKAYEGVEQRIRDHHAMRLIPSRDRRNLFLNEARLLYASQKYDQAADRLAKEDEITGVTTDGRYFLVRGNIGYRRAIQNYRDALTRDSRLLEESLLGSEDTLRESLRLDPEDWDAKYNFEYVNKLRKSLAASDQEKAKLLEQTDRPQTKELPPESVG